VDSRFGLYLRPTISSAVNAYGLYSIPSLSGNPATTGAGVLGSVIVTQPTSGAIGLQAGAPIESGSGVLTNWFGMAIDTTPTADKTVGLYIGRGTPFTAPADYAIYSVETNSSLLSGPLDLGNADTTLARSAAGQVTVEGKLITGGEFYEVALSDETTAITTGTAKVTVRAPFAMTVTAVRASLSTVSSSGTPTVDINEGGTTILSTKLTIDASEKTSTTAATPPVISDTAIADDAELTFDIDTAGTGAAGLKVRIYYTR
jgi:hypothetical protein